MKNMHTVLAAELPICPFCQGSVYYETWVTHRLFHMECINCKSHWRTGISRDVERQMYVELVSSNNPSISQEYFERKLPLGYWQKMMKKP